MVIEQGDKFLPTVMYTLYCVGAFISVCVQERGREIFQTLTQIRFLFKWSKSEICIVHQT
jgi:hypothetical protein